MTRLSGGVALAIALGLGACAWPIPADATDPTRRVGGVGRPVLELAWERTVHDRTSDHRPQEFAGAAFYARVVGDLVFVASQGGKLLALEAATGREVWRKEIGAVSSRPLAEGGAVYVGTDDGTMLALNTYDGRVIWRFQGRGAVQHAPVGWGELLVFATDADRVFAIERATGKARWQYERDTPEEFTQRGHGGVAVDGDVVYAGFADGHVVALAAGSGDVKWVRSLAGSAEQFVDVDVTPLVEGDTLYAASAAGGLYALDKATGRERWRAPITGVTGLAAAGGRLYAAAAETGIAALDPAGHVIWRQGLAKAGDPARPVIDGGLLLLSTATDGLFVIDERSGRLVQSWNPGDGISSEPTLVGDRLYVLSNGGVLYAMNLHRP